MTEPSKPTLVCSVEDCKRVAVSWLRIRGMGSYLHAHVCAPCETIECEHADVIESGPLPCPERLLCPRSHRHLSLTTVGSRRIDIDPVRTTWVDEDLGNGRSISRGFGGCATCDDGGCGDCSDV